MGARDPGLGARVALHRMMEAGPEESPRAADGKVEPAPLEDLKHVDLRRDAAGLPPLAQSICIAERRGS